MIRCMLICFAVTTTALFAGRALAQPPGADYSLRFVSSVGQSDSDSPADPDLIRPFETSDNPTMGRAILYSLLLPGLGDYYLGHHRRAGYFFATEAGLWTAFAVFRVQGRLREDTYIEHAARYAGVTQSHTEDFYATIRDYDSSDDYAVDIKNEGRFILIDGSASALDAYYLENRIADFEPWQWSSLDSRVEFQILRSDSENAYRNAEFAVWGAVANRVVSAIVTFASFRMAGSNEQVGRYQLDFTPPQKYRDYDAAVSLTRSF